jgi:hypothetical protein
VAGLYARLSDSLCSLSDSLRLSPTL